MWPTVTFDIKGLLTSNLVSSSVARAVIWLNFNSFLADGEFSAFSQIENFWTLVSRVSVAFRQVPLSKASNAISTFDFKKRECIFFTMAFGIKILMHPSISRSLVKERDNNFSPVENIFFEIFYLIFAFDAIRFFELSGHWIPSKIIELLR